jgi:hypothetical protein
MTKRKQITKQPKGKTDPMINQGTDPIDLNKLPEEIKPEDKKDEDNTPPSIIPVVEIATKILSHEKQMCKAMQSYIEKRGIRCKTIDEANPTAETNHRQRLVVLGHFDPTSMVHAEKMHWKIILDPMDLDDKGWAKRYFVAVTGNEDQRAIIRVTNNTELNLLLDHFGTYLNVPDQYLELPETVLNLRLLLTD